MPARINAPCRRYGDSKLDSKILRAPTRCSASKTKRFCYSYPVQSRWYCEVNRDTARRCTVHRASRRMPLYYQIPSCHTWHLSTELFMRNLVFQCCTGSSRAQGWSSLSRKGGRLLSEQPLAPVHATKAVHFQMVALNSPSQPHRPSISQGVFRCLPEATTPHRKAVKLLTLFH